MNFPTHAAFYDAMLPYAQQVAAGTGLLPSVVLCLMAEETAWGSSALAQQNNMTGIKYYGRGGTVQIAGGFAGYPSLDAWAQDMIAVVHQDNMAVIEASAGQDASHQITAIAESPYDGDSYQGRMDWANKVLWPIYQTDNLGQYDAAAAPTPPTWRPTVTGNLGGTVTVDTAGAPQDGAVAILAVIAAIIAWHAL